MAAVGPTQPMSPRKWMTTVRDHNVQPAADEAKRNFVNSQRLTAQSMLIGRVAFPRPLKAYREGFSRPFQNLLL